MFKARLHHIDENRDEIAYFTDEAALMVFLVNAVKRVADQELIINWVKRSQ